MRNCAANPDLVALDTCAFEIVDILNTTKFLRAACHTALGTVETISIPDVHCNRDQLNLVLL